MTLILFMNMHFISLLPHLTQHYHLMAKSVICKYKLRSNNLPCHPLFRSKAFTFFNTIWYSVLYRDSTYMPIT